MQFFKDVWSVQYEAQQHNKSCATHNPWTNPSDFGDHCCLGITFAAVQALALFGKANVFDTAIFILVCTFSLHEHDVYACECEVLMVIVIFLIG